MASGSLSWSLELLSFVSKFNCLMWLFSVMKWSLEASNTNPCGFHKEERWHEYTAEREREGGGMERSNCTRHSYSLPSLAWINSNHSFIHSLTTLTSLRYVHISTLRNHVFVVEVGEGSRNEMNGMLLEEWQLQLSHHTSLHLNLPTSPTTYLPTPLICRCGSELFAICLFPSISSFSSSLLNIFN